MKLKLVSATCHGLLTHASQQHRLGQRGLDLNCFNWSREWPVNISRSLTSSPRALHVVVEATRPRCHGLLSQPRDVPHAHCLVKRGGDDHVLGGVELRAHDIVVVACQHRDTVPALPVPDADCLVVAGGQNPWVLVVENGCSDVIKVAEKGEDAAPLFVVPNFYLVVVTTTNK